MPQSEWLKIRIDPERLALLEEFQETHGVPVSEVVRRLIDHGLRRTASGGIVWLASDRGAAQRTDEHFNQRLALGELRQKLVEALNKVLAMEAAADRAAVAQTQ
jgi:hypothetical protein